MIVGEHLVPSNLQNTTKRANLNPSQAACVECTEGALMMLAGAGAGKTRTLIAKIVHLLEQSHTSPSQILALTFSNKAAKEMRQRLGNYFPHFLQRQSHGPMLSTFHSFCAYILRQECELIGLTKNFTIYDDGDTEALIKTLLARRGVSTKQTNPKMISSFIDRCKNRGIGTKVASTIEAREPLVERFLQDSFLSRDPLYSYFLEYENELIRANALDFGGLITAVLELFLNYPEKVLTKYQNRFKYILVDEYQDTNKAQFLLLYLLSKKSHHLCVVGDEDQSIYSWRGADISNILDFEKYFPNYQLVKLEQNYRSSSNIISAASKLIENNVQRKDKKMWTENSAGELIQMYACRDDFDEAQKIVDIIENESIKGASFDDMAILYRSSACSRSIEDELRRKRIPYRVIGGIKFYERKEVKDVLAYLKLIVNFADNVSLARIINIPVRGIGTTSLKKMESIAVERNSSLFQILEEFSMNSKNQIKLSSKATQGIREFVNLIKTMQASLNKKPLTEIFQDILKDSGYKQDILSMQDQEAQERWNNLEQLYNAIAAYEKFSIEIDEVPSLEGFLQTITLDQQTEDESRGVVSLMTVHAAKGLEFPFIFILGAEEGTFPSYQSLERGESALEEERRLFYVAMTRAMSKLTISYARGRMLWGQIRTYDPSQFLHEIPLEYVHWNTKNAIRIEDKTNKNGNFSDKFSNRKIDRSENQLEVHTLLLSQTFPKGALVKHQTYGEGVVVGVEGSGDDEKVMIKFHHGSLKKFMVKFANIERLD